jgi:dephospho-CoA kinase
VRLYGLTGGIASGKSTAAHFFRELGVPVIDADQISRLLVQPGEPALIEIGQAWPGVIRSDHQLDRKALAEVVFASPRDRERLEQILHPRIQAETLRRAEALAEEGHVYSLYEAALIFETGGDRLLNGVILVSASPESQTRRLVAREGFPTGDADRRIAAQLPLEEKRRRAQWILENDGDPSALQEQIVALDAMLRGIQP